MDNLKSIKDDAAAAIERIKAIKTERAGNNADIASEIAGLESMGLNRHAVRMAIQYSEFDIDKRKNFDFAYNIVREAIKLPLQPDLFEEPDTDGHADPEAAAG